MLDTPAEKLDEEIARVERMLSSLEAEWRAIPRLLAAAVLVVPAWALGGPLVAFLVLVGALSLVGVAAYLVGGRIREARDELVTLRRDRQRAGGARVSG